MPRYLINFLILTTFLAFFVVNRPSLSEAKQLMPRRHVGATLFGATTVFADPPDSPDPSATADDASKPIKMPETFSVNKYLKTEEQTSMVPGTTSDPTSTGVVGFLIKAIDLFVKIIGAIALVVFILGALLTILSEGKEDRLEKGKSAMIYALIGLIITFMAFIIVSFVQSIFF